MDDDSTWSGCKQRTVPDDSVIRDESSGPMPNSLRFKCNYTPISSSPPAAQTKSPRRFIVLSPTPKANPPVNLLPEFSTLKSELTTFLREELGVLRNELSTALQTAVYQEMKQISAALSAKTGKVISGAVTPLDLTQSTDRICARLKQLEHKVHKALESSDKEKVKMVDKEVQAIPEHSDESTQIYDGQPCDSDCQSDVSDEDGGPLVPVATQPNGRPIGGRMSNGNVDQDRRFLNGGQIPSENEELHVCRERSSPIGGVLMRSANHGAGYGRVQDLRMDAVGRNQQLNHSADSGKEKSMMRLFEKYLPPEELSPPPCDVTPTPATPHDSVFIRTNVSFAMSCPPKRKSGPCRGRGGYPPRNFPDRGYYPHAEYRYPVLGQQYHGGYQREQRERYHDWPIEEGRFYREEHYRGAGRGDFCDDPDCQCHPEEREVDDIYPGDRGERYPVDRDRYPVDRGQVRRQHPKTGRILDITAIMNQPKLL